MTTLIQRLETIRPGASWTLSGDTYGGLTWLDESQSKPTIEELEADGPLTSLALPDVELLRRKAYESTADPLFFKWQRGEATEQEWLDAVQAVKDQYPKPATLDQPITSTTRVD